jgi:AraC-like DNA-binding protein
MIFTFEQQPINSSFVESIWRTRSEGVATQSFTSAAATQWQMVITKQTGETRLTVRGPATKSSPAPIPENAEFIGINFPLGTHLAHHPTNQLVDLEHHIQHTSAHSFWFRDSAFPLPNFDDADLFVERLVRQGLLVRDPIVEAVLQGATLETDRSLRSVQRRFVHSTGLTHAAIRQIERAHQAVALLEQGLPIADVIFQAGYFDQSHLSRLLKRLIGRTPAQITRGHQINHTGSSDQISPSMPS